MTSLCIVHVQSNRDIHERASAAGNFNKRVLPRIVQKLLLPIVSDGLSCIIYIQTLPSRVWIFLVVLNQCPYITHLDSHITHLDSHQERAKKPKNGDAGFRTQDLLHAKQALYH